MFYLFSAGIDLPVLFIPFFRLKLRPWAPPWDFQGVHALRQGSDPGEQDSAL